MFCPQCGSRTPDDAAFCNACGASLSNRQVTPSYPEAVPPVVPAPPPVETAPLAYNTQTLADPPVTERSNTSQHYAAPLKAPNPTKPKRRHAAPPKATGKTKALTVLLCFLFCLFFLLSSVVGMTRSLLSKDNIEELVQAVDVDESRMEYDSLAEFVYASSDSYLKNLFTERALADILDMKAMRDGVADMISGYTEYFIAGKKMKTVDADTVLDLMLGLERDIQNEVSELYEPEYGRLEESLNRSIPFDTLEKRTMQDTIPVDFEIIQFLLSPICYGILIFLTADFLLLLFIVNRRNLCYLIAKLSTVSICLGAFYLFLTLGGLYNYFFPPFQILAWLTPAVSCFNALVGLRAGILLVLGIAGRIISAKLRRREAAPAAKTAV